MSSNRVQHGKTVFQKKWLSEERFKFWFKPGKKASEPICAICNNATINVEKMRVAALLSHGQGTKHKSNLDCFSLVSRLYFQGNTSTASEAPSAIKSTLTLDNLIDSVSAAKAEIRWVLKVVDSNFSLRSCPDLNDLFESCFQIAQLPKTSSWAKQWGYYINFGVAPYVRKLLKETIEISPFLTILSNGSLNGYVQKEQMDIKVIFWCDGKCKVTTRYLDSKFLANCLMLSMDGPNTSWSVLNKVSSPRQQMELPSFFDVGCCGLHTLWSLSKWSSCNKLTTW